MDYIDQIHAEDEIRERARNISREKLKEYIGTVGGDEGYDINGDYPQVITP